MNYQFNPVWHMERRRRRVRVAVIMGTILLMIWLVASFVWRELEIRRLTEEIAHLHSEKTKISSAIEELKERLQQRDDLKLLEYLARKELGMAKPSEEVYFIIESEEEAREP